MRFRAFTTILTYTDPVYPQILALVADVESCAEGYAETAEALLMGTCWFTWSASDQLVVLS